jgi:hypothetical protein
MIRAVLVALAGAVALAAPADAHKASDSYLHLTMTRGGVDGRWDIALRDLEQAVGLDGDGDGAITWGELKARHAAITAYVLPRLGIGADGAACAPVATEHLVDSHTDGAYAVLRFAAACPAPPAELTVAYRLFAEVDPLHRGLLRVTTGGGTHSAVLGPEAPELRLAVGQAPDLVAQVLGYGWQGVWHIWIGFDHILFLLSLLLPAVMLWRAMRWQPVDDFRAAFWDVFRIVTSFTVAHSITLSLAALHVVSLPSRLVESAIAASVVVAALNNLRPVVQSRRWLVAFGFGLIHGFGFASVLAELGLPSDALLIALVGFNLGVEAGQLAIVALFLPLAFSLRRSAFYRRAVMAGGSVAIAGVAGIWLVERAFGLSLLSA